MTDTNNPNANCVDPADAIDTNISDANTNPGEITMDEPTDVPEELAEHSIEFESRFIDMGSSLNLYLLVTQVPLYLVRHKGRHCMIHFKPDMKTRFGLPSS